MGKSYDRQYPSYDLDSMPSHDPTPPEQAGRFMTRVREGDSIQIGEGININVVRSVNGGGYRLAIHAPAQKIDVGRIGRVGKSAKTG